MGNLRNKRRESVQAFPSWNSSLPSPHHLPIISCCNLHVLTDQNYNTVSIHHKINGRNSLQVALHDSHCAGTVRLLCFQPRHEQFAQPSRYYYYSLSDEHVAGVATQVNAAIATANVSTMCVRAFRSSLLMRPQSNFSTINNTGT